MEFDVTAFRKSLLAWGRRNFRYFPWRQTTDPHRILVAEVMLHRTQAKQVKPVYEQFVAQYPDVDSVVQAPKDDVVAALKPLGLTWRSNLTVRMFVELKNRFSGRVPSNREDLLSLPGVGNYIASAVRCFAFGLPDPIVDTNSVRVVTRVFGIEERDSLRRSRGFHKFMLELLDPSLPRAYNYALLDLASKVCKVSTLPDCALCPLNSLCHFRAAQLRRGHKAAYIGK